MTTPDTEALTFTFSRPQWAAWTAMERFVNVEGAYRSGKTTVALLKVGDWCWKYPGICWFIGRWTQDATDAQLKPRFLELCGPQVRQWLSDENCYLLESSDPDKPSRVYVRGLKPSEGTSPFSKIHGLTIACGYIDQPEEVPEEYFLHFHTRLSQPGYPQQLLLTPNPVEKQHWIARHFPIDDSRRGEGYRYIKITMRDNVRALGAAYVANVERTLKSNPAEYRRGVLGERGVPMKGRPVYQGLFDPDVHVQGVRLNPSLELIEIYDFGHRHPAVTWVQFPPGGLHILGGVMGENLFLEDFIPYVEEIRGEWFPDLHEGLLHWTCDPAGSASNSHGTQSAVQILNNFGIHPHVVPDANTPPKRTYAIQTIGAYLRRRFPDGSPVCLVNRRFVRVDEFGTRQDDPLIVDGFSVGYVWDDDHAYVGTQYGNLRRPRKDGWYEHPFNTLEYGVIAFAPPDAAEDIGLIRTEQAEARARRLLEEQGYSPDDERSVRRMAAEILEARLRSEQEKAERRALRAAQHDHDPDDLPAALIAGRRASSVGVGYRRGGY